MPGLGVRISAKRRFYMPMAGMLAVMLTGGSVWAATSASFEVSADIVAGCAVDGVGTSGDAGLIGTLDFGHDTTLSTASHSAVLSENRAITVRCTPGVTFYLAVDGGLHSSSGVRNLQMGTSTTDRLAYRLFSDAGMTDEIGIGQNRSILVTAAAMNDVWLPIHARLALPGGTAAGTYTDTLLITLTW